MAIARTSQLTATSSRVATELAPPIDADAGWTVATIQKDFVDWRRGRSRYAVWAIDLDLPSLGAACARMRRHLDDYLLPQYRRQPHITLRICGFPGPNRGFDDDYTPELFTAQIEFLERARIRPFSLGIGSPGSFPSAAYFSVRDDDGGIARVRQALADDGPGEKNFPYLPHVTFGLYRGRFPMAEVLRRMRSCPGPVTTQVTVGALVLMTYQAAVIGGPLTACAEFDLERQSLRILDADAMSVLLR